MKLQWHMDRGESGSMSTNDGPSLPEAYDAADVVHKIMRGEEQIVSYEGSSQYAAQGAGSSACGIAALNCARIFFRKEHEGLRDESLLKTMIAPDTTDEITSICAQWPSKLHLEVEDIVKVPLFERTLKLSGTRYSRPNVKVFKRLLEDMQTRFENISAAVVITRPPEIITCLKIITSTKPVYVIYDSHPRPEHPRGAGLIFNISVNETASRLGRLFAVDDRLLADTSMQWEAQLLSNISGHTFISKGHDNNVDDLVQAILESSVAVLALRAEINDLKLDKQSLAVENQRLEKEIEDTEIEHLKEVKRLQSIIDSNSQQSQNPYSTLGYLSFDRKLKEQWHGSPSSFDSYPRYQDGNSERNPASRRDVKGKGPARSQWSEVYDDRFGITLDNSGGHFWDESNNVNSSVQQPEAGQRGRTNQLDEFSRLDPSDMLNAEVVMQQQREFEEEDRRLRRERDSLAREVQPVFTCVICMDDLPKDYVARLNCKHEFCRECIRGYVVSKVREHRYPILCPCCVADKTSHDPGVVNEILIQEIGIEEKDYQIFIELQLSAFSILLHCRKCKNSAFVDRTEYQEQKHLVCPLPRCNYAWCKACQQAISSNGPQHSCDGTSELAHLMKEQGWKHCPGCQTPIQKVSGCNHMTCMSPGCNSHFCYVCGQLIVQSSLASQISTQVSAHYRKCRLFEG